MIRFSWIADEAVTVQSMVHQTRAQLSNVDFRDPQAAKDASGQTFCQKRKRLAWPVPGSELGFNGFLDRFEGHLVFVAVGADISACLQPAYQAKWTTD